MKRRKKERSLKNMINEKLIAILRCFKWYEYVIVGTIMVFFLVVFLQNFDIWHTANCSLAYHFGHIDDFYDYNIALYERIDYYPFIYLIFAIWNIPLKIANITAFNDLNTIVLIYEQILCAAFLFISTIPFYKICRKMGMCLKASAYAILAFMTTPVLFLITFGWGQYESITIFFLLLGFYFFIREKRKIDVYIAMIFFGFAISLKLFSLFIIIPLVAYRFKNIFKLLLLYGICALPLIIQIIPYLHSPAFVEHVMGGTFFVKRMFAMSIDGLFINYSLLFVVWGAICLIVYFINYEENNYMKMTYLALASFTAFLLLMPWHPQWFGMLAPFSIMLTVASKNRQKYLFIEAFFALVYIVTIFMLFVGLKEHAILVGGLKSLIVEPHTTHVIPSIFQDAFSSAFMGLIVAALGVELYFKNPWKYKEQYEINSVLSRKDRMYLYARFIGPLLFYAMPLIYWVLKAMHVLGQ